MKLALGLSLLSLAALPAATEAQVLCTLGTAASAYDAMADMPASSGTAADFRRVKGALCPKGCGKVALFSNPSAPNAVVVTDGAGVSKISYSPKFLAAVEERFGPAATLGIFAHALGHHVAATNDPRWIEVSWDAEQRADAWAACALARVGLRPSAVQAAVRALSAYPVPGHPDWSARASALRAGYTSCGGARTLPGALEEASDQERVPGCRSDRDCRNGRICSNGRCGGATVARRCGKDTDCPEPQECTPTGRCVTTGGAEGTSDEAHLSSVAPAAGLAGREVALEDGAGANKAAPVQPPNACVRSCDDGQSRCVQGAVRDQNQCVATVQANPTYKACGCPNYPEGNYACYRSCTTAYEQAKACSVPDKVRDCQVEADHCRSHC